MYNLSRKTKIVATIGPGSSPKEAFTKLLHAGVTITRENMSHGDHDTHRAQIANIRAVSKKEKMPVGILVDLSGPKIRIGDFVDGVVELVPGQQLILSGKKCDGTAEKVFFNYPHIKKDIKPGQILMLDDGKKKVEVVKVEGVDVYTKVIVGGKTKSRRGVNIPGAYLSISAITEKDEADLAFAIEQNVDFIALSFVRTAKDVESLRAMIKKQGGHQMIISKIETEEAIENIDAIIEATDGIMVARGDLAVEVGPEKVPVLQKMMISKCNALGKPVIVATQMLESMINSPVPTRAEVSDVANAIFDGADAVMLSEESALGEYAVEAVAMMNTIAQQVEGQLTTHRRLKVQQNNIADSVGSSVVHNAEDVSAKAIVALTESGFTARTISRYKPLQPIFALTAHETIARQLLLSYGCVPVLIKPVKTIAQVTDTALPVLVKEGVVEKGDTVVVAAGVPFNVPGTTNMMMITKA